MTGASGPDVRVLAVSGQPMRTADDLRHALERAAAVGELVISVRPRDDGDEVTLYYTEAHGSCIGFSEMANLGWTLLLGKSLEPPSRCARAVL